jgi:lambda repressor-like predicted transcriptional regulator
MRSKIIWDRPWKTRTSDSNYWIWSHAYTCASEGMIVLRLTLNMVRHLTLNGAPIVARVLPIGALGPMNGVTVTPLCPDMTSCKIWPKRFCECQTNSTGVVGPYAPKLHSNSYIWRNEIIVVLESRWTEPTLSVNKVTDGLTLSKIWPKRLCEHQTSSAGGCQMSMV